MILILDGNNGVGKSEYAKLLAKKLKWPIVRPFRNANTDIHLGYEGVTEHLRKQLRVPANTHVDDVYVADILAATGMHAILDRSMPSAIAYGKMHNEMDGWYDIPGRSKELLEYWQSILKTADCFYVWLTAPRGVSKERCGDRWCPNKKQWDQLERVFINSFMTISLPKRQIDTSEIEISDGVESICRALRN